MTTSRGIFHYPNIQIVFVFSFLSIALCAETCSLASHKWRILAQIKIPLSVPVLPLSEYLWLENSPIASSVGKVFWVLREPELGIFPVSAIPFFSFLKEAVKHRTWSPIDPSRVVQFMEASNKAVQEGSLLLGSDKTNFLFGWFSDENSHNLCHEIVLRQESRSRAVALGGGIPWADEFTSSLTINITLSLRPFPGKILSLVIMVDDEKQIYSKENNEIVQALIQQGILLPSLNVGNISKTKGYPVFPENSP
ncbi:hypothetical protein HYY75_08480 [bacterium]|nr:hypothetical protein [bacterium]